MSWRSELRGMAAAALAPLVPAGQVYQARTWPLVLGTTPVALVNTPTETKESLGRASPMFTLTTTLAIFLRLAAATEAGAEAAIEALSDAAESALLTNEAMMAVLQQVAHIETQILVTPEAKVFVAEAALVLACETYWEPALPAYPALLEIDAAPPAGTTGPSLQILLPQ